MAVATPYLRTPCPNCGCAAVPAEPALIAAARLPDPGYFMPSGNRGLSLDELVSSEKLCICDECNFIVDRPSLELVDDELEWWP